MTNPIFVVGAGRSGSTAFFDILTYSRQVTWLTNLSKPAASVGLGERLFFASCDLPIVGDRLRRRYYPSENYAFWNALYPGFANPCRDLVADDVSQRVRNRIRRRIDVMRLKGRETPLIKITGWPRVGFLNAIFPEARFIHIVRDGRAVANSLLNVSWWRGWQGPSNWRWGELGSQYEELWVRHDRSFVALAGIQWRILMDAMRAARREVDAQRFLEIRYEDLCAAPGSTIASACSFGGIRDEPRILEEAKRLRTQNEKWQKELTPRQQTILTAVLEDGLRAFSYDA
jgi:Sulfotransferase family